MQAAGEHWLPVLQATRHAVDVMETMPTTAYYISARHFAAADLRLVPGRQGTGWSYSLAFADAPVSAHEAAGHIPTEHPAIDANPHCPYQPKSSQGGQVTRHQRSVLAILEPNAWSPYGTDMLSSTPGYTADPRHSQGAYASTQRSDQKGDRRHPGYPDE